MHHLNDITDYLNAKSTIINDITILDRSFIDMELLKPIYGAIALLTTDQVAYFGTKDIYEKSKPDECLLSS